MERIPTVKLFCADALTFDYSKIKADYILSSPPFFKGPGSLFGDTDIRYLERCTAWFQSLLDKVSGSLALVNMVENHFTRVTSNFITPIDFPMTFKPDEGGKWYTVDQSSLLALISRYFGSPAGKTLLDPYCGGGSFLLAAKAMGMDVVGIDSDEEQIERASVKLGHHVL